MLTIFHQPYNTSWWKYAYDPGSYNRSGTISIHRVNKSWTESVLSDATGSWSGYLDRYETTEEDNLSFISSNYSNPSATTQMGFNVKNAISGMASGLIPNNGFIFITNSPTIHPYSGNGGTWTSWYSSENTSISNRPKLTITYTGGVYIESKGLFAINSKKGIKVNSLTSSRLVLSNVKSGRYDISIFNTVGKKIVSISRDFSSNSVVEFGNVKLTNGAYIIKVSGATGNIITNRIVR